MFINYGAGAYDGVRKLDRAIHANFSNKTIDNY